MLGRKRFIAVDARGLTWAPCVTTADVPERDGGCWLPGQFRHLLGSAREVTADSGYSRRFVPFARRCGWKGTTTATAAEGFRVHPRRWVVERTVAWLSGYRRLGKDHEDLTDTSEAMIDAAMTHRMRRRLPGS